VTDRDIAFEITDLVAAQYITDKSHSLDALYRGIIICSNTTTLLSPVLETEKSVINITGGVLTPVNSEYSAFFMYGHA
jgi:hypothetical protein